VAHARIGLQIRYGRAGLFQSVIARIQQALADTPDKNRRQSKASAKARRFWLDVAGATLPNDKQRDQRQDVAFK